MKSLYCQKMGKEYYQITGKTLDNLIAEIIKSAELVNSIVLTSKEQQSGVENF